MDLKIICIGDHEFIDNLWLLFIIKGNMQIEEIVSEKNGRDIVIDVELLIGEEGFFINSKKGIKSKSINSEIKLSDGIANIK